MKTGSGSDSDMPGPSLATPTRMYLLESASSLIVIWVSGRMTSVDCWYIPDPKRIHIEICHPYPTFQCVVDVERGARHSSGGAIRRNPGDNHGIQCHIGDFEKRRIWRSEGPGTQGPRGSGTLAGAGLGPYGYLVSCVRETSLVEIMVQLVEDKGLLSLI